MLIGEEPTVLAGCRVSFHAKAAPCAILVAQCS